MKIILIIFELYPDHIYLPNEAFSWNHTDASSELQRCSKQLENTS